MTMPDKELNRKLLYEYGKAKYTLLDSLATPLEKQEAKDIIRSALTVSTAKQVEIILSELPDAFLSGIYIEADYLKEKIPAYTGFDLNTISKTHMNRITTDTIGSIGNFNKAVSKNIIERYELLLTDNELVDQITKSGWTTHTENRLLRAGYDNTFINLVKQQTTTNKMIEILEMQGIQGGMHPNDVAKSLQPHIRAIFGEDGVTINNVGKMRRQFTINADGHYKWINEKVTRSYHTTIQNYSETLSRSSMMQAHIDGRTETLEQSGLVQEYRSIANMTSNTCSLCAMMHGQIVSPGDGPEYHARCGCRLQPVWKKETGLANHSDEFYESQRDQHFWKQHQLKEFNKTLPKGERIPNYNFLPKEQLQGMPDAAGMREIRARILRRPEKIGITKNLEIKPEKITLNKIKNMEPGTKIQVDDLTYIQRHAQKNREWELHIKGYGTETVKRFPTPENLADAANGKITGLRFKQPLVTKERIPIVELNKSGYRGADMRWTETLTESGKLKEMEYAYHYSDMELKSFGKKTTCFFDEWSSYSYTDTGYRITLPKGTYVERYGNEIRVNLEKNHNLIIEKLKSGWSDYETY